MRRAREALRQLTESDDFDLPLGGRLMVTLDEIEAVRQKTENERAAQGLPPGASDVSALRSFAEALLELARKEAGKTRRVA